MPTKQPQDVLIPRRYLTTAIPYVNAVPHIGFALEAIQADALARFYRQQGWQVRFQAGTDENSIKNVQAAETAGLSVVNLVERNAARFLVLKESLDLSYDDFIRTSADQRHRPGVERLWKECFERGDIYKRAYSGLYCTGCEQFYKAEDLDEGKCPEHGTRPELIEEENWFFRLSRYESKLRDLYVKGDTRITPDARRNEVLSWIEQGLEDFSISRNATRARGWGIPVPGDPEQVIYVWFDALGNYISALGYGSDNITLPRWWTQAISREHVIGKGITRFHAIYWPAILLSAGLPVPTRILVHGYVTVEGRKIGKSAGNAIDPLPLTEEFGPDALRYFLLRHIRSTGDGDFSHARFRQAYDSELAGQLGNLVHRVLSMIESYRDGFVPAPSESFAESDRLLQAANLLPDTVATNLRAFAFDRALDAIWAFVADANRYVAEEAPWELAKVASSPDSEIAAAGESRLDNTLLSLAVSLVAIAKCIAPLLPRASRKLLEKFSNQHCDTKTLPGTKVSAGMPLFPKP